MPHIIKKLSNLSTYFKKNKAISTEVPGIRLKAVEGLGTIESNGILGHDFLPNWMIFFHLSTTWLSNLYITKKKKSVNKKQLKNRNLIFINH
jgi:hypothetical protein